MTTRLRLTVAHYDQARAIAPEARPAALAALISQARALEQVEDRWPDSLATLPEAHKVLAQELSLKRYALEYVIEYG